MAPSDAPKRLQATRKVKLNLDVHAADKERLELEWKDHLQALPIRTDGTWTNVDKVVKYLENAQLETLVRTNLPSSYERTVESLLTSAPIPGRNVIAQTQSPVQGTDSWQIRWSLNDTGPYAQATKQASISDSVPYFLISKGQTDTIANVASVLRDIHNIWPYPDTDPTTRSLFVQIAVRRATGSDKKIVLQPTYDAGSGLELRVRHINPYTGLAETTLLSLTPSEAVMGKSLPVPDLPPNVLLYSYLGGISGGRTYERELIRRDHLGNWPSVKPPRLPPNWSKECFDKCERFMLHVSERLTGVVGASDHIDQVFTNLKLQFDIPIIGTAHTGVYGGRSLFRHDPLPGAGRGYVIRLAQTPAKDLGLKPGSGTIILRSLQGPHLAQVLDAGLAQFMLAPDPRVALLACAKMADQINMDLQEGLPPEAGCTAIDKGDHLHHCARCTRVCPCSQLNEVVEGARVCNICINKEMPTHQKLVEKIIKTSFNRSIKKEMRRNEMDPISEQALNDEALQELLSSLPSQENGPAYVDGYAPQANVGLSLSFGYRRDPATPVVDAAFPRIKTPRGIRKHAPGNLVITRDPTNRAKWDQLPGWVQELGQWFRLDSRERTRDAALELMARATSMQQVRLKRSARFTLESDGRYTDEELRRETAEYLSGRPCSDGLESWEIHATRFAQHRIPPTTDPVTGFNSFIWTEPQIVGLRNIARQYQAEFNVTLQYSVDGCPYVGLFGAMEPKYSWNGAAILCQERYHRMKMYCNKHHSTIDTEFTLFAEMIRSACIMMACLDGRCPQEDGHGPSHLPVCLRIRHGLRLAVAHRHHGRQMFTGWKVDEPINKYQRDESLNNILIEACTTNWTKWDYDEKFYRIMHENIASAQVPLKWYDPTARPLPGQDIAVATPDTPLPPDVPALYLPVDESSHGDASDITESGASGQTASRSEPVPQQSAAQLVVLKPSILPEDYADGTFHGYALYFATTSEFGYPRKDSTFATLAGTVVGKFSEGGDFSDSDGLVLGNIRDIVTTHASQDDEVSQQLTEPLQPAQETVSSASEDMHMDTAHADQSDEVSQQLTEPLQPAQETVSSTSEDMHMDATHADRSDGVSQQLNESARPAHPAQSTQPPRPAQPAQNMPSTPETTLLVVARVYQGNEVPGRLPGNHPLAGFVVRGPPLNMDNFGFGDTSYRFRNQVGDVLAHWQQLAPNTFAVSHGDTTLAFVQREGDESILFSRI